MITTRALIFRLQQKRLAPFASFAFARSVNSPTATGEAKPKKISKASDFIVFDPSASKYGLPREDQVRATAAKRVDAPEYLRDEQKYRELTQKEYKLENPVEAKQAASAASAAKEAGDKGDAQKDKRFKREDAKKNK